MNKPEGVAEETAKADTGDSHYPIAEGSAAANDASEQAWRGPTAEEKRQKRPRKPRVVIVGSGFGGLNAARALAGKDVDVLVLDRNNYHGFWPLLYQVATAGIESESIAYPVRAIFRKYPNINFRMWCAQRIDLEKQVVYTDMHPVQYDYLLLAAGSTNNYFGNNALAKSTFGLKDIVEAERLRNNVLLAFERAAGESDPEEKQTLMSFVIIGGGPTGVELAGAFSELIHFVLKKDYPGLDLTRARVILVEATDKIMAAFPDSLQRSARKKLEQMGVELKLNSPVESVEDGCVTFKDSTNVNANIVVWAAGVKAVELGEHVGVEPAKSGRLKVEPALNIPGHPEAFVIGDMAYLESYHGDQAYPQVAQVAIQQGKHAARNILARVAGKPTRPFRYFDEGTLATIGRRFALMDAFGLKLSGRIAWFGWLFVHIVYLIGFRNRIIVLLNWAWNYFSYERAVRLITGQNEGNGKISM